MSNYFWTFIVVLPFTEEPLLLEQLLDEAESDHLGQACERIADLLAPIYPYRPENLKIMALQRLSMYLKESFDDPTSLIEWLADQDYNLAIWILIKYMETYKVLFDEWEREALQMLKLGNPKEAEQYLYQSLDDRSLGAYQLILGSTPSSALIMLLRCCRESSAYRVKDVTCAFMKIDNMRSVAAIAGMLANLVLTDRPAVWEKLDRIGRRRILVRKDVKNFSPW